MRVLLVGKGSPDVGGIPTFLEMLRAGDLSRDHDVQFLNVAHHGVPEGGKPSVGNVVRTLRDASAVWRQARGSDVVHLNSALVPTVTLLRAATLAWAAKARGSAVVLHAHGGNLGMWLVGRRRRWLMRLALWPVDRVAAVWSQGHSMLGGVLGSGRVVLIDNGVDTQVYRPVRSHTPTTIPRILYVGLLTPRKGVLDLFEASRLLRMRGVAHELRLVGGTPDEGLDAEFTVRTAASDAAQLLGTFTSAEMPLVYSEADIFCLPSWWEAMPLSVLEAMACGLPVVATQVGDIPRAVEDGVTGFVVPPQSPRELADALERLVVDAGRRQVMGDKGRRRIEQHFSIGVMTDRLIEVLDEARSGHR